MKSEDIIEAMNEIDEEFVESANSIRKSKRRKNNLLKWISAVAAISVIAFIGIGVSGNFTKQPTDSPDSDQDDLDNFSSLPILEYEGTGGAFGFEGYMAYDISELDNGNPYNENMNISTLPVYRNNSYNTAGIAYPGIGKDAMLEKLQIIAESYNSELEDIVYNTVSEIYGGADMPGDTVCSVTARIENFTVKASSSGEVVIYYNNNYYLYDGIALPDEFSFTYNQTSEDDAYKTISYICQNYCNFIDKGNVSFVTSGDYTYSGEFSRDYSIYDFSGDDIDNILNFSFNKIQLAPNDLGNLMLIRIYSGLDCGEKIGDYPIISSDDAKALLVEGKYLTSVPYEFSLEENIARVELIYRSSVTENIWMPYYRFLVEIPEEERENGLKTFGAYYVPAVEMKYISGLTLWDGSFN